MLQRKQTLYLLFAIICTFVCSILPIGYITPQGMGADLTIYQLFIKGNCTSNTTWPLFVILLCTYPLSICAIFMYKQRKKQAKLCMATITIYLLWYAYYIYATQAIFCKMGTVHLGYAAILPILAIIFCLLARKGIINDEKLIRSVDRIR